jgi:hypothetical protein
MLICSDKRAEECRERLTSCSESRLYLLVCKSLVYRYQMPESSHYDYDPIPILILIERKICLFIKSATRIIYFGLNKKIQITDYSFRFRPLCSSELPIYQLSFFLTLTFIKSFRPLHEIRFVKKDLYFSGSLSIFTTLFSFFINSLREK